MAERPIPESVPPKSRFARLLRFLDRFAPPVLLAAFLVVAVRELLPERPRKPKQATSPSASANAAASKAEPGVAQLKLPAAVPHALTRISLYRGGTYAELSPGVPLKELRPEALAELSLPPGVYVAMFHYRGEVVGGDAFLVSSGQTAEIEVPLKEMAGVEYLAGVKAARQRMGHRADIARFRRTLALDPGHVNARLQLAADALARGDRRSARAMVRAVRKVDPKNPHATRIARLLGQGRAS